MYMHAMSTILDYHPNWQPRRRRSSLGSSGRHERILPCGRDSRARQRAAMEAGALSQCFTAGLS
jgi:hypothetical protein